MKLKVFAGPKVIGEVEASSAVCAAIASKFAANAPYEFNVRAEQEKPIKFHRRMPDKERVYTRTTLSEYGVVVQGNPSDIYYLLRKGKL